MANPDFGFRYLSTQNYYDETRDILEDEYALNLKEISSDIDEADDIYNEEIASIERAEEVSREDLIRKNKLSVQGIRKSLGNAIQKTYGRYTRIGAYQPTQFGLRNLQSREMINDDDRQRVLSGASLSESLTSLDREVSGKKDKSRSKNILGKAKVGDDLGELNLDLRKDLLSIDKNQSEKMRSYLDQIDVAAAAYSNPMAGATGQSQTNRQNRRGPVIPYSQY